MKNISDRSCREVQNTYIIHRRRKEPVRCHKYRSLLSII